MLLLDYEEVDTKQARFSQTILIERSTTYQGCAWKDGTRLLVGKTRPREPASCTRPLERPSFPSNRRPQSKHEDFGRNIRIGNVSIEESSETRRFQL